MEKKKASVVENMLVALFGIVMVSAILLTIIGCYASISDKWNMRQVARETLLVMETEGYLLPADKQKLENKLKEYGLSEISFSGTTVREVGYGQPIVLSVEGTYQNRVLSFSGGISKVAFKPSKVRIVRESTAKQ